MRTTDQLDEGGRLALQIDSQMVRVDLSIRGLAEKLGQSYEHIRKIRKGEALPSKGLLKAIAAELRLPARDLERMRVRDSIERQYGPLGNVIADKDPVSQPLERIWALLSPQNREVLLSVAQSLLTKGTESGKVRP